MKEKFKEEFIMEIFLFGVALMAGTIIHIYIDEVGEWIDKKIKA
jgi:hypothetical protein